ncbi:MAG: hypothetical protein Q4C56_02790 [Peptococcaceae bacterium]|nr:hypothetical protein [Peptococcaceae bacterium]
MLLTPLGEIEILFDNEEIEYDYTALLCDPSSFPDLDGRFFIKLNFKPDGKRHTISCRIKGHIPNSNDDIESGENLELKSFYRGTTKLSIGMEGDSGYFIDGTRASDTYDYDNDYLPDGVEYIVLGTTETEEYVFAIAWIDPFTEENEIQTWEGADPYGIRLEHQTFDK